jgi:hypothetical protein
MRQQWRLSHSLSRQRSPVRGRSITMHIRPIRVLAALSSLAAVGAITASGLSAASAAPAAHAAKSGTEHFQLVTASATSNKGPVIAYGLFGAAGTDHMGNTVDKFVFKAGTFKVWHSKGTGAPRFNTKTCVLTATIHGTFKVYGGTGTYAKISGHGHYVVTYIAISKRKTNGSCNSNQNALPAAVQQIIQASGPIKL